jgi:superfamily II DNA or RNA helicase
VRADRPYQAEAIAKVLAAWQKGERSVCLVAPTGAGKTHMSVKLGLERGGHVLWSAHRNELVKQGFAALHALVGGSELGLILPGHDLNERARIQVSSTQTLVQRGKPNIPDPATIVLDEFHHYAADEFKQLVDWWPNARILGPTATPQRGDGKPLSDIATFLVVAAQYTDLIRDGFLCDAVVFQPPMSEDLEGALATDPVDAWLKYGGGMSGFAFMPTIDAARALAASFNDRGIPAECIDAKTKKRDRASHLERFAAGELTVICNVDTMTEGVDVPSAGVAMLGRKFLTVGAYLQACGRVLRPHPRKPYARIIDLTGATHLHCPPTINREYSLDGAGIKRGDGGGTDPVRNCSKCGHTYLRADPICPLCGSHPVPKVKRPPFALSLELQELWAGEWTRPDVKQREYARLREEQRRKGELLIYVTKKYRLLFGTNPQFFDATPAEKKAEFYAMKKYGDSRGMRAGYAAGRFKDMFGHWPKGI